jgi:hypothetical protein
MKKTPLRLCLLLVGLVLLGLGAVALSPGPDRRTLEGRFERVHVGMSQTDTERIFGGPPQASGSRPDGSHVDAWFSCQPPCRVGIVFNEHGVVQDKVITPAKEPAWELRWLQVASHFKKFSPW